MAIKLLQSLFGHASGVIVKDISYDIEKRLVAKGLATYNLTDGTGQLKKTVEGSLSSDEQQLLIPKNGFDISDEETPVMGKINPVTQGIELSGTRIRACTALPKVIAHRGAGSLVAPENSLSANKIGVSNGFQNIEQDVYLLSDGALAVMHDSTADRTTSGTGSITGLTGAQFKALSLDPSTYLSPVWQNEAPPLFEEVIREIGKSGAVLWPEAKNAGAGAAIVAALKRHGIPKNCAVVQSFMIDELKAAAAEGYGAAFGLDPAAASWGDLQSRGVTHLFHSAWTAPQVAAAKAVGITPVIYTVNRRVDWAAAKAVGVEMVFSDDPLWTSGAWKPMKQDPFAGQTWTPGMLEDKAGWRGSFVGGSAWGFTAADNSYQGCLQGWACPIGGNESASAFTIDLLAQFDTINGGDMTRHIDIFVCANSDLPFTDNAFDAISGYNILVRMSGLLQIYKKPPSGAVTKIAEYSGAALSTGRFYDIRISVTPNDVSISIPSLSRVATVADSSYRGGYFHIGRNGVACRFKQIVIS